MENVAFYGGGSICELGPADDVAFFFDCVRQLADAQDIENHDDITDRLFKRYLRKEELDEASKFMNTMSYAFAWTAASEWIGSSGKKSDTLDGTGTLYDVFSEYFRQFSFAVESAQLFEKSWNIYQPVRIVSSDRAQFFNDKTRLLSDYDQLVESDPPFWLR